MPKVSVIMPVYNTEKYLPEAISSILNQDFLDFEFIILDDFSTDNSWEIIQEFAKKDERIRVFKNTENKWISFCRNRLVELANTEFLCNQDSDDISEKNRISLLFDFLSKNPDFVYKLRIRSGQTKSESLKQTIKNTLKVQKKAIKIYWIKASFSDYFYQFLERILLLLPSGFVLGLFKKLEYKNDKK